MPSRRTLILGLAALPATLTTACAVNPTQVADDSRTYCLKKNRPKKTICTPERIPSAAIEAQSKLFTPTPGVLTLYIVRWEWVDAVKPLTVSIGDDIEVVTLPKSFIRVRLSPGPHALRFEWDGKTRTHPIEALAGATRFVELTGSSLPWAPSYEWSDVDPAGAQQRARDSRLIADVSDLD